MASSASGYIGRLSSANSSSQHPSSASDQLLAVAFSGLAFYAADVMLREVAGSSPMGEHHRAGADLASTLQTLQSVSIIMFTNSLVNYAMLVVSGGGAGKVQQELATLAVGLVAVRTIMQILRGLVRAKEEDEEEK